MKAGDRVRVFPHGCEKQSAIGLIVFISKNQRSIVVGFSVKPPFVFEQSGTMIHPEHGVVMLAVCEELNGAPWGPWEELVHGGHYEIEAEGA